MPRHQQRATQSDDEHSAPPTPRSSNHESHGRIEAWFEDHEDNIQVFLIKMNKKQINIPKVLRFSWLRAEGFESLFQQLKHQKLKTFLELSGKNYPDLVKVFFSNLEFKNDMLLSSIKGIQMEINKKAWKDVVGLKTRGVQVRKGETEVVPEFNKVQYYGQCLRNPAAEIKHFHVGGLKVDQRLLAMIVTKIIVPRGSNHSTLNEGDLILMYCIQHNIQVDWIYVFRDHMLKAKRLTNFRLPYVVLVSKFIEYFGIDVEGELEESTGLLNHTSNQNLHKIGFLKVGNAWTVVSVVVSGAHDHEASSSGANQKEEPTTGTMDLTPYNPPKDRGHVYSHFERMVLNQLYELNVSQHAHHNYCNERFNALDGQIQDIHDMLNSFQTINDP